MDSVKFDVDSVKKDCSGGVAARERDHYTIGGVIHKHSRGLSCQFLFKILVIWFRIRVEEGCVHAVDRSMLLDSNAL